MAAVSAIVAGAAAVTSVVGGAVAANQAKQAAKGANNRANAAAAEVETLKSQRQTVINPYAGVKDLSGMAQDLSGQIRNPYAQLGVATQAAEMQAEEADIALANTLDTLRATGAAAGGATALAQAALKSKQGISANIEQQEAQNEKLKAQGESQMQQLKMAEQQRIQGVKISEGQRVQAAEAEGKAWQFAQKENRLNADLDRAAGKEDAARAQQASANQAKAAAWGGVASSIGSIAGAAAGGGFGKG